VNSTANTDTTANRLKNLRDISHLHGSGDLPALMSQDLLPHRHIKRSTPYFTCGMGGTTYQVFQCPLWPSWHSLYTGVTERCGVQHLGVALEDDSFFDCRRFLIVPAKDVSSSI
jgi:hypothetical protein